MFLRNRKGVISLKREGEGYDSHTFELLQCAQVFVPRLEDFLGVAFRYTHSVRPRGEAWNKEGWLQYEQQFHSAGYQAIIMNPFCSEPEKAIMDVQLDLYWRQHPPLGEALQMFSLQVTTNRTRYTVAPTTFQMRGVHIQVENAVSWRIQVPRGKPRFRLIPLP